MGTSQSSNGSPSGVPMVPPWAAQNAPLADRGRFAPAKRNLGDFLKNGNQDSMRRGVGQYIKKGYGGSSTATSRMSGTAAKSQALYSALLDSSQNPLAQSGGALDPALMAGKSINEVMDAIVEVVAPIDGTQDAEVSRESIKDALSELLDVFPNVDLLNLDDSQREFVLERFVSCDVYQRLHLDLGKSIQSKAPTPLAALSRLKEVKDYVKETVAAAFRQFKQSGVQLRANLISQIVSDAIYETFEVFEGYAQ
jgi:hypothetical protein